MFTWIVTGAAGHLGGTIVRLLQERKAEVRGLVLPHESGSCIFSYNCKILQTEAFYVNKKCRILKIIHSAKAFARDIAAGNFAWQTCFFDRPQTEIFIEFLR